MLLENLDAYLTAIEEEMKAVVSSPEGTLSTYYGMILYHLGWMDEHFSPQEGKSGKRLRPLLCLLCCEASGGDWRDALPAAAAVELIHNFSLIHDDIEDNSYERRHRPTLWSLWGQAHGINAGDGLFVIARLALHRLLERGVSADKTTLAFRILDEACLSLTEGQYLDLAFEGFDAVGLEMYLQMVQKKTAALIECATHMGAVLGTEKEGIRENYRSFGHQLGVAFQIADDVLGIWGQQEATGKGVGEDIINKKKSLPVAYALEKGNKELREIYRREEIGPQQVERVIQLLDSVGAQERARQMANHHYHLALQELDGTGIRNAAQDRLRKLALFLIERRY